MPRRSIVVLLAVGCLVVGLAGPVVAQGDDGRPNILFAIADDWGYPHASAYGDPVVETPTFDRIAREGVLFQHAYVSSPSCTPSRGALLTGQQHWRLGAGANLWCVFPDEHVSYPELLHEAGYAAGCSGKAWGPGQTESPQREIAGRRFKNFEQFLEQLEEGKPFCFWLGTGDPHRPYNRGSGAASGMNLQQIELPACFPDSQPVRSDVADYYFEVQRFDRLVRSALRLLEARGELDNTVVVMTGDHGMPFPRCKAHLYDTGARVPLAIRWPKRVPAGRTVTDFVSLTDLAPTFLEAAAADVPPEMSGRSLMNVLASQRSGRVDAARDFVLVGKERHTPCQEVSEKMGGYPCRAIRTDDFLFIRNYAPDRWPAGTPRYEQATIPGGWYGDTDNGPTKRYMVEQRDKDPTHRRLYELAFAKRPADELYDLRNDPHQLHNVAGDPAYRAAQQRLAGKLSEELAAARDPREIGGGEKFDQYPYLGGIPKHPDFKPRER